MRTQQCLVNSNLFLLTALSAKQKQYCSFYNSDIRSSVSSINQSVTFYETKNPTGRGCLIEPSLYTL